MNAENKTLPACKSYAKSKARVKSGCRTCKIRKVKCDEGRPACCRCISTGRVCDGYGVWGGGGNSYGDRHRDDQDSTLWPSTCISLLAAGTEEKRYFEWFKWRTTQKIPGLFVLTFWDTLLLQACLNEPAVLHAVLTLSSVHRRNIHNSNSTISIETIPDKQEQFMLQQYTKAIKHIRPHLLVKERTSVRITLISCAVFVCLELLSGNFQTARSHLQSGLNILSEAQSCKATDRQIVFSTTSNELMDDWIVEAFSRLHVQVVLFERRCRFPISIPSRMRNTTMTLEFQSFNQAWQPLEQVLMRVVCLTEQSRCLSPGEKASAAKLNELEERQRDIKAELLEWSKTYNTSKEILQKIYLHGYQIEGFAFQLLSLYHAMATIMVDACLRPHDELVFDQHTELFLSLVNTAIKSAQPRRSRFYHKALPGHPLDMSRCVVDIGWLPPLYYTALKCRVPKIRMQAIMLMESSSHREGFWDAKIAACIARKVMAIEHGGCPHNAFKEDTISATEPIEVSDADLLSLSNMQRLNEIDVILPNGPRDSIFLLYKQPQHCAAGEIVMKEFDGGRESWTDQAIDINLDKR